MSAVDGFTIGLKLFATISVALMVGGRVRLVGKLISGLTVDMLILFNNDILDVDACVMLKLDGESTVDETCSNPADALAVITTDFVACN